MKESDFSQFSDPRVREVMAAAANLVEALPHGWFHRAAENLKTALFAAQHSKPRCDHKGIGEPGCETCDPRVQHSAPKEDRLWVELAKAASIDGDWSWERVAQRAREYIAEEIARDRG